ncbi:pepsin-like aspartic protease [Motilimonas sp. 1_MG-2023]|uniref:pepsin-like aspartic protease n=1 Tax=Motilimonas sp. 1_MG-2023 TaxID=3062672 RepID=UPI0026E26D0F|nr:pepsin-like aspartic protease [Motilimonas sp. 1_MG-2023]MDO6527866.1 pepsin-like aspartic protease [Motilimonas sp. 1_MG-2023]
MTVITNHGFNLPLKRGPFQSNGATPWYCDIGIGSPKQTLKICFDTGSDFNWITSSLCAKNSCKHYANKRFDYQASNTFTWRSQTTKSVSFGPWGTMSVETGNDKLTLSNNNPTLTIFNDIYLAKNYSGQQFAELDWDGGIGLPSRQSTTATNTNTPTPFRRKAFNSNESEPFHFFLNLMQKGLVSKDNPYISILTAGANDNSSTSYIGFGTLDNTYASSLEYLFLPWSCYQQEASYLWTTPEATISVGGEPIGTNMFFALDTGSSQFKGDNRVLSRVFQLTDNDSPVVTITIGNPGDTHYGRLEISSNIYKCRIEAGTQAGKTISQFQGLEGAENILLVGSVLMDHLYTVYEYEAVSESEIRPKGIWIFNKPNGPKIIVGQQPTPATIFLR